MSFEEEFDKIIRQKAEEAKYPFEEGNWERAGAMLDADRKAARIASLKKIGIPAAIILAIGSVAVLTYTNVMEPASSSKVAVSTPVPAVSGPLANTANANVEPEKNSTASVTSATEVKDLKEEKAAPVSSEATIVKSGSAPVIPANTETAVKKVTARTEKNNADIPEDHAASSSAETSAAMTGGKPEATTKQNNTSVPADEQAEKPAMPVAADDAKDLKDINSTNAEPLVSSPAEKEEVTVKADEMGSMSLNMELPDQDLMATTQIPLMKFDEDYYKSGQLPKKHYLNLEAGAAYLMGWDVDKTKDGRGLNYFGGFNYGIYLGKKVDLSIGLQAYNISHIEKPFYTISNKEYGFGSTSIYTVIASNNLIYAALPVRLNYSLGNSSIGLGVNTAYLFSASSTMETYYFRDNEKIITGSEKNNKVYKGTRDLNIMLSAAYSLKLSHRYALMLEYTYGLTDVFKNAGRAPSIEKTMGLRAGIRYTIFDK